MRIQPRLRDRFLYHRNTIYYFVYHINAVYILVFQKNKRQKKTRKCSKENCILSYDVASGSEITPCNKICKPLVVYRFTGNVTTSITTLRT